MRLFFALEIPNGIKAEMAKIQARLEQFVPRGTIRWVEPEAAHFTIRFVGEKSMAEIAPMVSAVEGLDLQFGPIPLAVSGFGCYPSCSRPRVLWLGVHDKQGELKQLSDQLEEGLQAVGIPKENRPFTPHLTLGRINRRHSAEQYSSLVDQVQDYRVGSIGQFDASELVLFRSELKRTGAIYTVIHRFAFRET
jgi:2'-5' RNA ligase